MSPPEHGLVLWCNEKSQVGAGPHAARVAAKEGACHHDARLQALWHDHAVCHAQRAGRASHRLAPAAPHLHRVAEVPAPDRSRNAGGRTLHLIADHYATHKHLAVRAWLAKPPRLNMYFTPPPRRGWIWLSALSAISLLSGAAAACPNWSRHR
jgi:hypothetical protein